MKNFENSRSPLPVNSNASADLESTAPPADEPITWTVIIATHNRPAMLRRAVESALNQTRPCQIIVVDDASTDETPSLLATFPDVQTIRTESSVGQSAANNLALPHATGTWIKFIDDDDWLTPDCLATMAHGLLQARRAGQSPVIVTCRAQDMTEQLQPLSMTPTIASEPVVMASRQLLNHMLRDQAPIGTPIQVACHRDTLRAIGGWGLRNKDGMTRSMDTNLWIRLVGAGDALFLPNQLAYRTRWNNCISMSIQTHIYYRVNLCNKILICEQLGVPFSAIVESALALHWSLVSVKRREIESILRLSWKWLLRPAGILHYLRNRIPANLAADLIPIQATPAQTFPTPAMAAAREVSLPISQAAA